MAEKLNILQIGAGGAGGPVPRYVDELERLVGAPNKDFSYVVADYSRENADRATAGLPDKYRPVALNVCDEAQMSQIMGEVRPDIVFSSLPPSIAAHVLHATLWQRKPQVILETALSNSSGDPFASDKSHIPLGRQQELYASRINNLPITHITTGVNPGGVETYLQSQLPRFGEVSHIRFTDVSVGPKSTTIQPGFCPEAALHEGIAYPNKVVRGHEVYTHPLQHRVVSHIPGLAGHHNLVRVEHEEPITTGILNREVAKGAQVDFYMAMDDLWLQFLQTMVATGIAKNRGYNALNNCIGKPSIRILSALIAEVNEFGLLYERSDYLDILKMLSGQSPKPATRNFETGLAYISSLLPDPSRNASRDGLEQVGVAIDGVDRDGRALRIFGSQTVEACDHYPTSHILAQTAGNTAVTIWQAMNQTFDGMRGRVSMSANPKPSEFIELSKAILPEWKTIVITDDTRYGNIFSN